MRYTPALTMVAECSRADTGVGADMAPSSQEEKGICADLVSPAKESSTAGSSAAERATAPKVPALPRVLAAPALTRASISRGREEAARNRIAPEKASPPSMFSTSAREARSRDWRVSS